MGCFSSKQNIVIPYRELLKFKYPEVTPFRIIDIYDGDTLTIAVPVDKKLCSVRIRLLGINCPEIRGDERELGIRCRDVVCKYLDPNFTMKQLKKKEIQDWFEERKVYCNVLFHDVQTEKYGRYLATVYPLGSNYSVQDWLLTDETLRVRRIPDT